MKRKAKPTLRQVRSQTELCAASRHVWYELWMALSTAQVLSTPLFGPGVSTNAFLECFALHARAIVGFFFGGKQDSDDIVASDFFVEPGQWSNLRGKQDTALRPVAGRVGKEVAHLSYVRLGVTPEAKAWDVPAIAGAISRLATIFSSAAAPELLDAVWQRSNLESQRDT